MNISAKFWFLLAFVGLSMAAFTVFGSNGLLALYHLKQRDSELLSRIETIRSANRELRRQINLLRKDPDYIERIAREELNMIKPNEMVFRFMR